LIKAQIAKPQLELHSQEELGCVPFLGTYITPAILVANLVNIGKLKITFQFLKNMQIR
jgi:membrane fusion protein (multidrug efflux system)